MDQLTGAVSLISDDRFFGGTIPTVEASAASSDQDHLHRRSCQSDLMSDPIRTPTTTPGGARRLRGRFGRHALLILGLVQRVFGIQAGFGRAARDRRPMALAA